MTTFGQKLEFAYNMSDMEISDSPGNDCELRVVDGGSILSILDELRCDDVDDELLDCSGIKERPEGA